MPLPIVLACALLAPIGEARAASAPRCVAPAVLAAVPGEEKPVKGDHRFDAAASARTLAAYAPVAPALRGAIRRVELPKGRKLVALTLDLCEQPGEVAGYDGAIFDYLRANNIKATLFTGGKWMRSHATRFSQLMTDPLFEIANHGEAHRNLRLLAGPALDAEIAGPQRTYEGIRSSVATPPAAGTNQCLAQAAAKTPERLSLFRFPFGACNDPSLAAVNGAGLLAIQWDVSTGDPSPGTTAQQIANEMIHNVRPGSIVIAHANGRGFHTAAGLPLAIPKLLAAGYEFVTVSELLAAGRPVIAATCYNTKPGDTDRYDHPLGLLAHAANRGKPGTASGEVLPWQTAVTRAAAPKRANAKPATVQKAPLEKLPWE